MRYNAVQCGTLDIIFSWPCLSPATRFAASASCARVLSTDLPLQLTLSLLLLLLLLLALSLAPALAMAASAAAMASSVAWHLLRSASSAPSSPPIWSMLVRAAPATPWGCRGAGMEGLNGAGVRGRWRCEM